MNKKVKKMYNRMFKQKKGKKDKKSRIDLEIEETEEKIDLEIKETGGNDSSE